MSHADSVTRAGNDPQGVLRESGCRLFDQRYRHHSVGLAVLGTAQARAIRE